jgi:two-component system phosphate regulon sensor histidine kinase PhoR
MENEQQDTLSIIAHELRTSLSATKWVLKMLLDEDLGPVTEKQKSFIEKTFSNNEHMIGLVGEIITHRKGEAQDTPYVFKNQNIASLVEDVLESFNAWANQRKVKLEFSHPIEEIRAEIHKTKFESVIRELVHNALKYTPEGGTVAVHLHERESLVIEIKDSGIGVNKEDKKRLFEKYFRGDKAQIVSPSGSGLGLYVVKHIIEKHEGTIEHKENAGGGSIFEIKIPYKR